jgi:hypothetical protein
MLTPQQYGRNFETEIHEFLKKTKPDILLSEKDIRNIDNTITAIDHLLVSNNTYYCFQDKWLKNNISNSDFNHFAKCVEKVSQLNNHNYKIYAVYLSNNDFSTIANKQFIEENNKYNNSMSTIEYVKINSYDKKKLFNELYKLLHINGVYMYDADGDCIMLI